MNQTKESIKSLYAEQETLKKEIAELKGQLSKDYAKKESLFSEKEVFRKESEPLIVELKAIKRALDQAKSKQEDLRRNRDAYNKKFKELLEKSKKLGREKRELMKKFEIKTSLDAIKSRISQLGQKIETEALQFDKEKKLMETIKKLKKKLQEAQDIQKIENEQMKVKTEIDETKKTADEFHQKLMQEITLEKENYRKFMELSKKVSEIKSHQEKSFQNFSSAKKEFLELEERHGAKLQELNEINRSIKALVQQEKLTAIQVQERILEQKSKEVEEKLKGRKKLTTQDLLVMQSIESRESSRESNRESNRESDSDEFSK